MWHVAVHEQRSFEQQLDESTPNQGEKAVCAEAGREAGLEQAGGWKMSIHQLEAVHHLRPSLRPQPSGPQPLGKGLKDAFCAQSRVGAHRTS